MLRITINRRRYFKSSGLKVDPYLFDEINLISKKVDNAAYRNGRIKDLMRKYERELYQVDGSITPELTFGPYQSAVDKYIPLFPLTY